MTGFKLFHDGAAIDESAASALMIDASLWRGVDIRDLRAIYARAIADRSEWTQDAQEAREEFADLCEIEIMRDDSEIAEIAQDLDAIPEISDSEIMAIAQEFSLRTASPEAEAREVIHMMTDRERFESMSFQSIANLVLRETGDSLDRLKAWEYLNASADSVGEYWGGLSGLAQSRILGAMALDLSAFGFIAATSES